MLMVMAGGGGSNKNSPSTVILKDKHRLNEIVNRPIGNFNEYIGINKS
jgi:hypothetical protein